MPRWRRELEPGVKSGGDLSGAAGAARYGLFRDCTSLSCVSFLGFSTDFLGFLGFSRVSLRFFGALLDFSLFGLKTLK